MRPSTILYLIIVPIFLFESVSIIVLSASLIFHSGGTVELAAVVVHWTSLATVSGLLTDEIIDPRKPLKRPRNLVVFTLLFGLSLANLVIFLVRGTPTETGNLTKDFAAMTNPRAAAITAIALPLLSTIFAIVGFTICCVVEEVPQPNLKISDPIPVKVWHPDTPTQFIELGRVQTGYTPNLPCLRDEVSMVHEVPNRERWTDIPV